MTSGLRKAHKYIWLLLIIIVPVIMIFSIKDLDIFSSKAKETSLYKSSKSNIIKVAENNLIKASLIEIDSSNSIEIILKTTLKNPTSIVYEIDNSGNKSDIIGQLTTSGIYNFKLNKLLKGVIIYDALKNEEITKLTF